MVRQQRFILAALMVTTTSCSIVDAFTNPSSSSGSTNALFKSTTTATTTTKTKHQRQNNNGPVMTSSSSLFMSLSITMPSPDSFSKDDMLVIQEAYEQWCEYYTKPYDSDVNSPKLLTFAQHFDMAEQYIELTGNEVALNQYADMTYEEHQTLLKLQQTTVLLSAIQDPKLFFISISSGIGKGGRGIGGKGSIVDDDDEDNAVIDEKEAAMQAMFAAAKARAAAKQQGTDPAKAAAEANKKKAEDRKARIAKRKQQQQGGGGQTQQVHGGTTTKVGGSGRGAKAADRQEPQWGYQVKYQETNPYYSTTPLLASKVPPQPKQQLPKTPSTAYSWLAKKHADEYGINLCDIQQGTGPNGHITVQDVENYAIAEGIIDPPEAEMGEEEDPYHGKKISIMWLAKKKAEELCIDYRGITGTGPDGRIEVKDVEDYAVNEGRKLLGSSDGSSGAGGGGSEPKKKKGGLSVGFQRRKET